MHLNNFDPWALNEPNCEFICLLINKTFGRSKIQPLEILESELVSSTHKIIPSSFQFHKSAGVKRYIFNSTCSVYGFNKKKVFENSKKSPISTYAKANFKAENEIFSLRNNNFK